MNVYCTISFLAVFLWNCDPRTGTHNRQDVKEDPDTTTIVFREAKRLMTASERGAKLFRQNCAVCHSTGQDCIRNGPYFPGLEERLPSPVKSWFIHFTLNSDSVIASGDSYALKIYQESGKASMPVFKGTLTLQQVEDIYCFVLTPQKLLQNFVQRLN